MPSLFARPHSVGPFAKITARGMLASAGAIVAGTMVAVLAAGGTYALWQDEAALSAGTVTSGTVGLTISPIADLRLELLVPGTSVHTAFTVSNTGNADLKVSAIQALSGQTNALASHLEFSLSQIGSAVDCTKTLLGPTPGETRIDGGQRAVYCLVVKLKNDAPTTAQGGTADFAITFNGNQVSQ